MAEDELQEAEVNVIEGKAAQAQDEPEPKGHTAKSIRSATISVIVLAVFAAAFIGLISFLDSIAPQSEPVAPAGGSGSAPAEEPVEEVVSHDPFYVVLIGSDSRKGTALYTGKSSEHAQVDQHADIITLVRVDPRTYTITLLTIPRDTVIEGESAKINDSLLENDPEQVMDAVERLTGLRPDYYLATTFIQFEDLIDAMGGIVIDVPRKVSVSDPATAKNVTVDAGKAKFLHGNEALVLARARKEYEVDEDALRQVNVRNIERAMILTALSSKDEQSLTKMLKALDKATVTNMDLASLLPLAMEFAEHSDEITFYSATGPHAGDQRESDGLWVCEGDKATYREIIELMDAGADPSVVVKAPTF